MENRVQKKKEAEKEKTQDEREKNKSAKLKPGDEAFPKYDTLKTAEDMAQLFKTGEDLPPMKPTDYLAHIRQKVKNKDNNGNLFWDGNNGRKKPFWKKKKGVEQSKHCPHLPVTNVFNGETILAVTHGLFQLPAKKDEGWRKDCDPYAKLSSLEEKDQTAFSNTVRSMLNVDRPTTPEITATELNQRLIQEKRFFEKKEREADAFVHGTVRWDEPTMALRYDSTRTRGYEVPFEHVQDQGDVYQSPPDFDDDCDKE